MFKASELTIPFKEGKREPILHDGLIAIPYRADLSAFSFPGWQLFFGNTNPVYIEYCSGNGTWIEEKAKNNPGINYLACEMKLVRAKKIWARAKKLEANNLRVALAEGLEFTKHYIPSSSVDRVYINFPDPWPKRRHNKNRIINPVFLTELARILKLHGTAIVVTDDQSYSEICIQTFLAEPLFEPTHPAPYYISPPIGYGTSFFEALFLSQKKTIRYHEFRRR